MQKKIYIYKLKNIQNKILLDAIFMAALVPKEPKFFVWGLLLRGQGVNVYNRWL